MDDVYVIIPHYEKWNLTHARLWELMKFSNKFIKEVLVVDDCSLDNQTRGGLNWWAELGVKTDFRVSSLVMEDNVGFLLASNAGIHEIVSRSNPDDVIILLSNDVQISEDFISQVTEILRQPNRMVGGVLYEHDTGWNTFDGVIYPYLEGWLLAMKSKDWETFGGFDERYTPSDFEDIDLSTTALKLGYDLVPLNHQGLKHLGGQSYGYTPKREARTKENREKFKKKWIK